MTRFNFIADMITMFAPKIKDKDSDDVKDDKKSEKDLFFKTLNNFCDDCLEVNLKAVFIHVEKKHDFATIPKMSMFWKFAEKNGFLKPKNIHHDPVWYKCKCGVNYSKEGRGCPKCRSKKAELVTGESVPDNLILVHEDCYYCINYKETIKKENERKMYGPTCGDYGKKQDKQCSACQCKDCCGQMIMYNADPRGTIEKYRTTELAQPWLMEREELPDVAQKMLDHMLRTKGAFNGKM